MGIVDQVKKLETKELGLGLLIFMAYLGSGLLIIFNYHRELITSLDVFKLILLSGAITTPLTFIDVILFAIIVTLCKVERPSAKAMWYTVLFCSIFVFYSAITVAYFWHLPFKGYLFSVFGFQVFTLILYVIFLRFQTKFLRRIG